MITASLNEIKKELAELDSKTVRDMCIRLAKFKKENKELLTYLLFEAHDEPGYVSAIKAEMDTMFQSLPTGHVYYIKKSLRKILRMLNKKVKYSGVRQTELELRLYFCAKVREAEVPLRSSTVLYNMNEQQLKKINVLLSQLPEDLRFDYQNEIAALG
jgi:hypothetical protein